MSWIAAGLLASVAILGLGARAGQPALATLGALAGVGVLIVTSLKVNAPLWSVGLPPGDDEAMVVRRNVRLLALTYAWGALALLVMYTVGPIRWRHAWQYAAGMALIAGVLQSVAYTMGRRDTRSRGQARLILLGWIGMAHVAAAVLALAWLVGSGKVASVRADWPANIIFVAGGMAVIVLGLVAERTRRSLRAGTGGNRMST